MDPTTNDEILTQLHVSGGFNDHPGSDIPGSTSSPAMLIHIGILLVMADINPADENTLDSHIRIVCPSPERRDTHHDPT